MKDTLYCPFMGGNPCMGRSCACAVICTTVIEDGLARGWRCGLANTSKMFERCQMVDHEERKLDDLKVVVVDEMEATNE